MSPEFDRATAEITFAEDGSWHASDGCNDLEGDYDLGDDGDFSASSGSTAGAGCVNGGNVPYDQLLARTDHVTFDHGAASFVDADGETLLSLVMP